MIKKRAHMYLATPILGGKNVGVLSHNHKQMFFLLRIGSHSDPHHFFWDEANLCDWSELATVKRVNLSVRGQNGMNDAKGSVIISGVNGLFTAAKNGFKVLQQ